MLPSTQVVCLLSLPCCVCNTTAVTQKIKYLAKISLAKNYSLRLDALSCLWRFEPGAYKEADTLMIVIDHVTAT